MPNVVIKALRINILLGLALITPLVVTVLIVIGIFRFITGSAVFALLQRWSPPTMRDTGLEYVLLGLLSLALVLAALFLIGFFTRSFLGNRLYRLGERLIERIPVINRIYVWVRQISDVLFAQRQALFSEVVLVEYPRPGLWSIGFVTAPVSPGVATALGADGVTGPAVSLFIPTTPNPTSGLMILAPRSSLRPLRISVSDAMKLIVSAGAVHPDTGAPGAAPDLVRKLESWIGRDAS